MAESRFQFKLLTGENPDTQYADITPHDPKTFYLLGNGKGYLGDVPLFDGGVDVIQALTAETATTENVPSSKAVMDYINSAVTSTVGGKFLRLVGSHTFTEADDTTTIHEEGVKVGDPGLLFTADSDNEDNGNETLYFVSLAAYIKSIHTFDATGKGGVTLNVSDTNEVSAQLKVDSSEGAIKVDPAMGISLNKMVSGFDPGVVNDNAKDTLITEAALQLYMENFLSVKLPEIIAEQTKNLVPWSEDKGTVSSGG